jgi:two-component system, cell cycle sensor histidine kinase and response regulator CckA
VQLKHLLLDIEQIGKRTFPKTIEIESDIPSELWTVSADATQLHQVFMNLVVNGRDAMPHGGTLSISGANLHIDESYAKMNVEATVGAKVVITVSDTGVGIPPEIIDRIFDPFFTTKEVGKGTGLGLSTVLGIVKSHGGFVEVSSKVGAGSQFKVYLPASEDTLMQTAIELELCSGNGELILVVDDETAIREITKVTLESHNYRVLTASDGIEAIASYAEHMNEISLVLMDMMMPTMDGAIASRTLRKMNPQVEIIAMSGLTSTDAIANATNIGIKEFLPKPFTAKELIAVLQRSFQRKQ